MRTKGYVVRGVLLILVVMAFALSGTMQVSAKSLKPAQVRITETACESNTSLSVKWKKVTGSSGYAVYRSLKPTSGFKKIKTLKGANNTTFIDKKLKSKKSYYYKVRAYKNVGKKVVYGKNSTTAEAIINEVKIRNIVLNKNKKVELSWYYANYSNSYYIYRSTRKNGPYKLVTKVKGGTNRVGVDKSVQWGKTYYYKIANYRLKKGKKVVGTMSQPIKVMVTNNFSINANSKPFGNSYMNNSDYNATSKHYYLLKSYLDCLENIGGGTLTIKGGTFQLWKTIYIPSGTTVKMQDGTVIKHSTQSKETKQGLLILVNRADMESGRKYTKYNGAHDIKILGSGNAVIDKEFYSSSAILMGHNKNVIIDGITFRNMSGDSHFIEMDACDGVTVQNCVFSDYKKQSNKEAKEAINLDTPDRNTGGFSGTFSSMDGTSNKNIVIQHNTFKNLPTAIGTHMYTDGQVHTNIKILNNKINNCTDYAVRVLNWRDVTITGNEIAKIKNAAGDGVVFMMQGVINPLVKSNTVSNANYFMRVTYYEYTPQTLEKKPELRRYRPLKNSGVTAESVIYNNIKNVGKFKTSKGTVLGDIQYSNRADFTDKVYWSCQ